MKSILQDEKKCFFTGFTTGLHEHHVFNGPLRKKSERYGLKVWLRYDWHIQTPYAVHNNKENDLVLKRMAQKKFEEIYGHEKFMQEFHKNYL
jgi:hypothetical protein